MDFYIVLIMHVVGPKFHFTMPVNFVQKFFFFPIKIALIMVTFIIVQEIGFIERI